MRTPRPADSGPAPDRTVRSHEPIAIVGIGCRLPGGVTDVAGFWRLLADGRDVIGEIPDDRMDVDAFYDASPSSPGRMANRQGGYLDHIDEFDAAFFGISPREAERMDPQQRLMLEVAWEALEDAGVDAAALDGARVGVYVGQWTSDFESRLFAHPRAVDFLATQGSGRYATSGRISYVLGLRGPSLTIDTACSSSLSAVHLACQALRSGECEWAFAGGVNVILQPQVSVAYSQLQMLAPNGRCRFGDAGAEGYVRSEGAAAVLLKPLSLAAADGDRVYAVIRGTAVNNDGRSSGIVGRPSQLGQEEMLRAAYAAAEVAPARVGYVEAHGTGTRVGDPVELAALARVLGQGRPRGQRCWVGSVKTNIGHTEAAAGVTGLVKAALALHHRGIPASLHFDAPNPGVAWDDAPLQICRAFTPWESSDTPRIAAVSSFGIAGSNAHIVLEEAPTRNEASLQVGVPTSDGVSAPRSGDGSRRDAADAALLVVSARAPGALCALASRYADAVDHAATPLMDLCAAAACRRSALSHRAVFAAASPSALSERLRRFAQGDASAADATGVVRSARPLRVAFVFPGQGSQWLGMTRELSESEPVFRDAMARCERAMRPHVTWAMHDLLEPGAPVESLDDVAVIQPVLVAVEIALAALWRSLGVEPAAVVGHSMGEVAAAHVAGALSLEDAMAIICRRSALMRTVRGNGGMALVELTADEVRQRIRGAGGRLAVAATNAHRSTIVSGDVAPLDALLAALDAEGVFARRVKVDVASHGPQMAALAPALVTAVRDVTARECAVPLYSTVEGQRSDGHRMDAEYWGRNLREPVRFDAAISAMLADGIDAFIELSPHPILVPAMEETVRRADRGALVLASLRREEPEQRTIMSAVGALWAAGHPVDLGRVVGGARRHVDLPLYPWQRERHWAEEALLGSTASVTTAGISEPDEESLGWMYGLEWRPSAVPLRSQPAGGAESRTWLVVADDVATRESIAAALRAEGASARVLPLEAWTALGAASTPDSLPERIVVVASSDATAPYFPLAVMQGALLKTPTAARVWFVTTGSQRVDPSANEDLCVDQAALWGTARVVAEEHPDHWGGLVDLDPLAAPDASARMLARHLAAEDGEDQVALRNDMRFVLRLARVAPNRRVAPLQWRSDGAYLITGGLGDVGLHIARHLADAGVRRLVLAGRTPLPPRHAWHALDPATRDGARAAAVRDLERRGVAVHVETIDVGDAEAVHAFAARWSGEGWPPIRGIVHAAGTLANRLVTAMDRGTFDAVLHPKLRGARVVCEAFPDADLVVFCSSTGAVLAQAGQANYAAANAGLDAVAHRLRARGVRATSIQWGVWRDTGLVRGTAMGQNVDEMARLGMGAMSAERASALLDVVLRSDRAVVGVAPIDWDALSRARAGDWPLLRDLVSETVHVGAPEFEPRASFDAMAGPERERTARLMVIEALARVLRLAAQRIDPDATFGSLGLTSLMAMELRNRLEGLFGRALSATVAWNYPTAAALATHLAGGSEAARAVDAPLVASDAAEVASRVGAMSDEEAILALRGGAR